MLNKSGIRELAYLVKIDDILQVEDAIDVEIAVVGGWKTIVKKNKFKPSDIAVYFEIDSKVPKREPFMFLESEQFKVKTQKYFKGTVISQGLLMSLDDFGDEPWVLGVKMRIAEGKNVEHGFLTEVLGVTYAETEDDKSKSNSIDKYEVVAQRRHKLFIRSWAKWMMRREWGKKVIFFFFRKKCAKKSSFFRKKCDKRSSWTEFIPKTDIEIVQNMPYILNDKSTKWVVTEKIDGIPTSFAMRKKGHKYEFFISSHNVVFDKLDKKCFYEPNVYTEIAERYNIKAVLKHFMTSHDLDWVYIQGEIYGAGIQKRDYSLEGHDFAAFNLATSARGNYSPTVAKEILNVYRIPFVPILDEHFILPNTVDEMLDYAASAPSKIDGGDREGVVVHFGYGSRSFKAVSNDFLIKYHS